MSRKKESGKKWVKLLVKLFSYQLDNCIYYNPDIELHSCRINWTTFSLLLIGSFFRCAVCRLWSNQKLTNCAVFSLKLSPKRPFLLSVIWLCCKVKIRCPFLAAGNQKNLIIEGFQCRWSKFKWLNVSVDSPCRMKIDSMHSLVT